MVDFNTIVLQQFFRDFVPPSKNTCSEEFFTNLPKVAHFIVGYVYGIPYRKPRTHRLRITLHYPHVDPHENPVLNADTLSFKIVHQMQPYWRRHFHQHIERSPDLSRIAEECPLAMVIGSILQLRDEAPTVIKSSVTAG
jgi:hypothetical protein